MSALAERLGVVAIPAADEELALALRVRAGDADARDELIRRNIPLAIRVAAGFSRMGRDHARQHEDYEAAAVMGLTIAVDRFDPGSGARFPTYATYWMRNKITAVIKDEMALVRVPRWTLVAIRRDRLGLPQDPRCKLSPESLEAGRRARSNPGGLSLAGDVAARGQAPGDVVDDRERAERLEWALGRLSDCQARVLRMRYGLGPDGRVSTFADIGRAMGFSREYARQVEGMALARLRAILAGMEVSS